MPAVETLPSLYAELPRLEIGLSRTRDSSRLRSNQRITNRILNPCGNFILGLKNISKAAIPAVSPNVTACCGFDELARETEPVARSAHTSFQHVAHSQLSAHLPDVDGLTLI